jgi:hypothetical protein
LAARRRRSVGEGAVGDGRAGDTALRIDGTALSRFGIFGGDFGVILIKTEGSGVCAGYRKVGERFDEQTTQKRDPVPSLKSHSSTSTL